MFSAVGLFLGLKSKISHEQNVIYFQFYIRLPNYRLLGSITFKKSPIRSIPLSILYRLFFETQGRKYGRILSWSCAVFIVGTGTYNNFQCSRNKIGKLSLARKYFLQDCNFCNTGWVHVNIV